MRSLLNGNTLYNCISVEGKQEQAWAEYSLKQIDILLSLTLIETRGMSEVKHSTAKSRYNECLLSASFDSFNQDFTLNQDF